MYEKTRLDRAGVHGIFSGVHNLNRCGERICIARSGNLYLYDRIGNSFGVGVVGHDEGHINREAEILLNVASHVLAGGSCDSALVADCGVVVRTDRQVDERQAHNIPLVEVGTGAVQRFAVNTSENTHVAVLDCVSSGKDTALVGDIVGVVEHLTCVLITLVYIVVDVMLGEFCHGAVDSGVTHDVDSSGIGVSPHKGIEVAKELHTCVPRNLHGVGGNGVIKGVLEHLRLVCFEGGDCLHIQRGSEGAADFLHLTGKVMLVGDFVVTVQLRHHSETDLESDPVHGVQCGCVLVIPDNARADIAYLHISVIVDNGNLHGVAGDWD